ncbi:hypothetical protein LSH36_52g01010 [Paralvinella palmiformis]|uniref:Kazal-like domain-containing protein n=1 Tax=Paralvinella palmiformis TaxID=53620 RepID=A0AAD9NCT5_9ANNE|nr:hypothetical protein LSH36_52g01010 [Paralvinella palmiformis]
MTPEQARVEIFKYNPCERVFCAFGARCVIDSDTNTGKCKCIEKCSALFSPVCGSDETSYSSECHLRRASCSEQKRILVSYQGSCNDSFGCEDQKRRFVYPPPARRTSPAQLAPSEEATDPGTVYDGMKGTWDVFSRGTGQLTRSVERRLVSTVHVVETRREAGFVRTGSTCSV